jgi:hypothetical protein
MGSYRYGSMIRKQGEKVNGATGGARWGVITLEPHFAIAGGRVAGYNALCLSIVDLVKFL